MIKKRFSLQTDFQEICPWKSAFDEVTPDLNQNHRQQSEEQAKTEEIQLNICSDIVCLKTEKFCQSIEKNKETNRRTSLALGVKSIQKIKASPLQKQLIKKSKMQIPCETTKKLEPLSKKLILFKSQSISGPADFFQEIVLVKQFSIRVSNPELQTGDYQFKNHSRQVNHNADRFFRNLNQKSHSQNRFKNPQSFRTVEQKYFATSKLLGTQFKNGLSQILKVKPKSYQSCRVVEKQMSRTNSIKINRNNQEKSIHVLDRILFNR